MGRSSRGWSVQMKAELWARWKAGDSNTAIARALEKNPGSVFFVLATQGGVARAPRCRSVVVLSSTEREEITRGLAAGRSLRAMARQLARAPSTISREITRHGGRPRYRAARG